MQPEGEQVTTANGTDDWAEGYQTAGYTFGYYRELSPPMLRLACLAANVPPPPIENAAYLELGFGQGVSINMHAAALPGTFWGNDFNPAHAVHAAELAAASGAGPMLSDERFTELAQRTDLPMFDVIVMHGIWSWISAENRSAITALVARCLRPGGILYLSYNCQPGWAAQAPLRYLLARLYAQGDPAKNASRRIGDAIAFARTIAGTQSRYFEDNPSVLPFLERLVESDRAYVAHEYLNADWHLTHIAEVADDLSAAKLSFAASARLLDALPDYSLRQGHADLLDRIDDTITRECVRDFLIDQKFRMDIFVKGARRLNGVDARALWLDTRFTLVLPLPAIGYTHATPMGDLSLDQRIYRPLVQFLESDGYRSKTVVEIGEAAALARFDIRELLSALMMLSGLGIAQPARMPGDVERARCIALNRHLCRRALSDADIQVLASPVLGGGKAAPQEHQLIVLAIDAGMDTPDEQALYLDAIFRANGLTLRQEGRSIAAGEPAIAAFRAIAVRFAAEGHRALLTALGVIAVPE